MKLILRYKTICEPLNIGIALFGGWSLFVQCAAFFQASFNTLKEFSVVPVLITLVLLIVSRNTYEQSSVVIQPQQQKKGFTNFSPPRWFWFVMPFILAGMFSITGSEWLFWLFSVLYLIATRLMLTPDSPLKPVQNLGIHPWEPIALVAVSGIAVLISAGTIRPDGDDAFYVSLAASAIDFPKAALYGFDNLCRSGLPLVEQRLHMAQTYEYFVALLTTFTKIPVRVLYYVLLPAVWSAVAVLVNWKLLRRFLSSRRALLGSVSLVALLILWGDGHHTYGNFAFVRIFQGKAIYLLVGLPMIVDSALEFRAAPNWRNWFFLMLHQSAAVGFTTNGVVIAPIASALVLLSGAQFSTAFWRNSAKGLAASAPAILAGVGMFYYLRQYMVSLQLDPLLLGYQTVLGTYRTGLVLLGLLILPTLLAMRKLRGAAWLNDYLILSFALLLCPTMPMILGTTIAPVFSWRIYWVWPVAQLLSLAIGAGAPQLPTRPFGWLKAAILPVPFIIFALVGPTTVSLRRWGWDKIGMFKVLQRQFDIAERLMDSSPTNALALVPGDIAAYLGGFQNAPRLVVNREFYLLKLRGTLREEDWQERANLFTFIEGETRRQTIEWVMGRIHSRGINLIAFRQSHPDSDAFAEALSGQNFRVVAFSGYMLATKSSGNPKGK